MLIERTYGGVFELVRSILCEELESEGRERFAKVLASRNPRTAKVSPTCFMCRVLVDGYVSFCFSFNEYIADLEQEPDIENEFDFIGSLRQSFVEPFRAYTKAAALEWVAEGIRCAYAAVCKWCYTRATIPTMCLLHDRSTSAAPGN